MKSNPTRVSRHGGAVSIPRLAVFGLSLFALFPLAGDAATAGGGTTCTSTLRYNPDGTKCWVMRVDPADVQSYQLTVTFDPTRAQPDVSFGTNGVIFKDPFTGTVTNAVAGQLVIAGSTATGNVTPGDVDTFEIVFNDVQGNGPAPPVVFTVGGIGATDFIQTFDPSNNATNVIPSAQIGTVSRSAVAGSSPFIWDPDGLYNNGTTGGTGTWSGSGLTFDNLPTVGPRGHDPALVDVGWGTANNSGSTNVAIFGGNPGTGIVNVNGTIPVGGLQFDMPGYQLGGGTLALTAPSGSTPTIEVRAGSVTLNTTLADNGGAAGITKTGPGTLVLGGVNTFTGGTTISAGVLSVSSLANGGLASGIGASPKTAGNLVFDGGTLQYTGGSVGTDRDFTINAGRTATIDVNAAATTLSLLGNSTGGGGLIKTGPGTLTLGGTNTHGGSTTVSSGVLQISSDQNLGAVPQSATAGMVALNGGTLRISSSLTLNPNRGVALGVAGGTVDVGTSSLIYAGVIDGPGNLIKVGAGTLTLQGSNLFGGTTTVFAGTLVNNGSLLGGVFVNSGMLRGTGTFNGVVAIGDGAGGAGDAILHPAGATGPVTMHLGGLSLNSDAAFQLTLNSTSGLADQLQLSGNANLGSGIAQLSVFDLGSTALSIGTTFTIISNPSGMTSGTFIGRPNGSTFAVGPNTFEIDYNVGLSGNNVQVKVVPEPDASALLAATLFLVAAGRRARVRSH